MITYLFAMAVILLVLLGWVAVQHLARLYAARHPEFGPAREEGGGCGGLCGCSGETCQRDTKEISSANENNVSYE
ncbi:MAG: chemotaxis protein [Pseudomonadota bacterium]